MNDKKSYYTLKYAAILITIASVVFSLFNWFEVGFGNESQNTQSMSFITTPELIHDVVTEVDEKTDDTLVDTCVKLGMDVNSLGGYSIAVMIPLGILKCNLLLSGLFALYGLVKCFYFGKKTKFLSVSQIMVFASQVLLYIVIFLYNVIDINISGIRINDLIKFLPTRWLYISTGLTVVAFVLLKLWQKKFVYSPDEDDFEEDFIDDPEYNIEDNTEYNVEDNAKDNIAENIEDNAKDIVEDNIEDDAKDNDKDNIADNIETGIEDNI